MASPRPPGPTRMCESGKRGEERGMPCGGAYRPIIIAPVDAYSCAEVSPESFRATPPQMSSVATQPRSRLRPVRRRVVLARSRPSERVGSCYGCCPRRPVVPASGADPKSSNASTAYMGVSSVLKSQSGEY